ncbi:MAG: ATP-binding cassette domain-containing protein [Gemmatimonadales bacterium]
MSAPAVRVERLRRTFGSLVAVDDLSFEVERGGLFGIVGPDGAGKTTMLRMLAGVLRATSGSARVAGVEVTSDPEAAKPRIAYMAQRFGLYEDLTVAENLRFYADLYRVPPSDLTSRLDRLYAFSRLGEFTDRLAGKLSGGMKQKLALSCCLVHRPEVLVLDEPTFGVDPISRRELWLILHEMVREGVTIVVSTSYMDEAERCDRVLLLDRGRALALDAPTALQARLSGSLLAIRADRPRAARDLLREHADVATATLFGDTVHVFLRRPGDGTEVVKALERGGVAVEDAHPLEPSLEDVFIRLLEMESEAHAA